MGRPCLWTTLSANLASPSRFPRRRSIFGAGSCSVSSSHAPVLGISVMDDLAAGLKNIAESLHVLAADFALQAEFLSDLFETDCSLVDELALQFQDDFVFLRPLVQGRPEHVSLCAALSALDQQLDAMSGQENANLWSLEGSRASPAWAEVRTLARLCLSQMP